VATSQTKNKTSVHDDITFKENAQNFRYWEIIRNRLSKLQAKSYHLWDITWENPPLTLVKCGDLYLGRDLYFIF
jgi:hypothetical protein